MLSLEALGVPRTVAVIAFAIETNIQEWVGQDSVWVVLELSVEPVELVQVAAPPISLVLSTGAG